MRTLAVGDTSSCANPVLDFHVRRRGFLVDAEAAAFQLFLNGAQVHPATSGERVELDVEDPCPAGHRLSVGRYVVPWTVPGNAALGRYELRAFVTLDGIERELRAPFEVVSAATPRLAAYATVAEMRDEGVLTSQASDSRLRTMLALASQAVERLTRQWFEPRHLTLELDGTGRDTLELKVPIAAIGEVRIGGVLVDPSDLIVYARHLDGMLAPDDRRTPAISLRSGRWPRRSQGVEVSGVFGFTEPTGYGIDVGATPAAISHVTRLLAMRELEQLASPDRGASRNGHRVVSEQTRDQSYSLAPMQAGSTFAGGTGDPEIDSILMLYRAPMGIGSV